MCKLKVGVIGTGSMGRNHVRILSEEKNYFDFVGIYDSSIQRSADISKKFGIQSFQSLEELFKNVDAVVIAVPSSLHKDIGLMAAAYHCHALIEKPLALNYQDALELTNAFENNDCILAVGHVERFNPVIIELKKILNNEEIYAIESRRYSSFDGRIYDANVVTDLLIHDVDIVCNLLNNYPIEYISSIGCIKRSTMLDYTNTIIEFSNGVAANLSASRITENKVRELVVHTKDSYIYADLLSKTLLVTQNTNMTFSGDKDSAYRQESITKKIFVPMHEPLRMELLNFYQCIENHQIPEVNGCVASNAIKICNSIIDKATNKLI